MIRGGRSRIGHELTFHTLWPRRNSGAPHQTDQVSDPAVDAPPNSSASRSRGSRPADAKPEIELRSDARRRGKRGPCPQGNARRLGGALPVIRGDGKQASA